MNEINECTRANCNLLKNRLWHRCFPVNFEIFLRTHLGDCFWTWLILVNPFLLQKKVKGVKMIIMMLKFCSIFSNRISSNKRPRRLLNFETQVQRLLDGGANQRQALNIKTSSFYCVSPKGFTVYLHFYLILRVLRCISIFLFLCFCGSFILFSLSQMFYCRLYCSV